MGKTRKIIENIQEEARTGFDLRARLMGVNPLKKTVTVYTDAATGKELGGSEEQFGPGGIVVNRRTWGVRGRLEEIQKRSDFLAKQDPSLIDEDEVTALETEAAALTKKAKALLTSLDKTALVFTLRAVPELVIRDTRRQTRQNLNIKTKGIDGREEEYAMEYTHLLLAASVESWVDNASGETHDGLTKQQADDLHDFLPPGQFKKLDDAMLEISFESQIGNAETDSADFS